MNPYAQHLAGRDPHSILAHTTTELRTTLHKIADPEAHPAPGKWSAKEILSHLADCEIVFAFRLRQTLAETNHTIQPFDQDQWATRYASYNAEEALGLFAVTRHWNLSLLKHVTPEDLAKPVTHPERGGMTFQTIVETMAGHDANHLLQLHALCPPESLLA
jgi:hypothetical protein